MTQLWPYWCLLQKINRFNRKSNNQQQVLLDKVANTVDELFAFCASSQFFRGAKKTNLSSDGKVVRHQNVCVRNTKYEKRWVEALVRGILYYFVLISNFGTWNKPSDLHKLEKITLYRTPIIMNRHLNKIALYAENLLRAYCPAKHQLCYSHWELWYRLNSHNLFQKISEIQIETSNLKEIKIKVQRTDLTMRIKANIFPNLT